MISITCIRCGSQKLEKPSRIAKGRGKYCSKKCHDFEQTGKILPQRRKGEYKICVRCGSQYYVRPSKLRSLYCSKKCRETKLKRLCEICRETFWVSRYKTRTGRGRFCSVDCYNVHKKSDEHKSKIANWFIAARKSSKNQLSLCKRERDWVKDQMISFRQRIIKRDGEKCRDCGSDKHLELHHIVSVFCLPSACIMPMNVILLCRKCHKKTSNFAGRTRTQKRVPESSGLKLVTQVIPHRWREYDTIGNWSWTKDGTLVVFISNTGNFISNTAILIHEMVEAFLCKLKGVKEYDVTNFDLMFEKERSSGKHRDDEEPGEDHRAPYFEQHLIATRFEREFIIQAGMMWSQHEENCEKIT